MDFMYLINQTESGEITPRACGKIAHVQDAKDARVVVVVAKVVLVIYLSVKR